MEFFIKVILIIVIVFCGLSSFANAWVVIFLTDGNKRTYSKLISRLILRFVAFLLLATCSWIFSLLMISSIPIFFVALFMLFTAHSISLYDFLGYLLITLASGSIALSVIESFEETFITPVRKIRSAIQEKP